MYKQNYLIGIYSYDKYELCEAIFESPEEFKEFMEIPLRTARSILSKVFHHKRDYIIVEGHRKIIQFIDTKEFE